VDDKTAIDCGVGVPIFRLDTAAEGGWPFSGHEWLNLPPGLVGAIYLVESAAGFGSNVATSVKFGVGPCHLGPFPGPSFVKEVRMKSELAEEIFALIEARSHEQPAPMEFELAYQARVAIDRIRFAIKHTEQFGLHTDEMRDANLQLLDALQRLESVDRRFQKRSQDPRARNSDNNNPGSENFGAHNLWPSDRPNGHGDEG
jgi:hypothetical protein